MSVETQADAASDERGLVDERAGEDAGLGIPHDTVGPDGRLEAPAEHSHPSDWKYVQIAIVLALLTALEVSVHYVDFGPLSMPVLMITMVIKFWLVVVWFMHLKFDHPIFKRIFYMGLFVAIAVYVIALSTFRFFVSQ